MGFYCSGITNRIVIKHIDLMNSKIEKNIINKGDPNDITLLYVSFPEKVLMVFFFSSLVTNWYLEIWRMSCNRDLVKFQPRLLRGFCDISSTWVLNRNISLISV